VQNKSIASVYVCIPLVPRKNSFMIFETKVALVIRSDLASWQKMNVAAFLASGIAAAYPESIGEPYEDASGNRYMRLLGQPMLVYGGDRAALARVLERANLNLVGIAIRAERKAVDKIVDKLKFHE
jgi:hypothetical protein